MSKAISTVPTAAYTVNLHRYSTENFPKILKIVDTLESIGKKHSATAGQVALAWLLAQGDNIIPIPGTTKEKVSSFSAD